MKKILLSALLSAFVLGGAFAQFNLSTNTTIGQVLKNVNYNDKDTFTVDFNSPTTTASTFTTKVIKVTSLNYGKDSVVIKKYQTQKGLQVKAFLDATTTTEYKIGSADCNNYGANRNPLAIYSVDSLKKILGGTNIVRANVADSISRPAACLFRLADGDAAFGLYPGKAKRVEYGFYISMVGKQVTSDITFDIRTLDAGNSGKTASYGLRVYKSSTFTPANAIGDSVANFYVTGSGVTSKSLAAAINVDPSALSNKTIYIIIKTLGTPNASSVTDAVPNPVDANNVPLITDPTIAFDNLRFEYQVALWKAPSLAMAASTANIYLDHNNGTVAVGTSSDYTAGTAVAVPASTSTPIKFYLTSVGRVQNLNLKESNDASAHQAAFSFAATGAVKAKDISGNFTVVVPYTLNINGTTLVYDLDIAAPVGGVPANDTLEVTTNAVVPLSSTRTVRFEITNGTRFWYDIAATGSVVSGIQNSNLQNVTVYSGNNSIVALN
ncbi:MAG TPA: hypothetical protein VFK73_10320, partial [Paludibacter sp.]|nr:hypothetical protein [Paludibacter sp.]